ncbi:MAG TPA: N,N-dimethylformamidase beta subunit family domain-containing protein [Acidisoma sp.]|uniref:N,N-dimethylformamidase beta subunit family domain-containing protein n=1 Tax=Acidisoma sp. TaxID=1872115 RepID=UPI002BA4DD92|nr:N,N-dimethylformamidase beta subunit family domain-containing protein [Acidisoma sp.]HTI00337.1 N,N-dimethylformamidase beta subunit family domain-containing protein [Acidisoma sp.]
MLKILGYPDRYSVAPGEAISFQISLEEGETFDARIVRVLNGDCNPAGPGLDLPHHPSSVDGTYPGQKRRADAGSFMRAEGVPPLSAFSFRALLWPTLLARSGQVIAAQWDAATHTGFYLELDKGRPCLVVGDGTGAVRRETLPHAMLERKWYALSFSLDRETGDFRISLSPQRRDFGVEDAGERVGRFATPGAPSAGPFYLAGLPLPGGTIGCHFNGKIEAPALLAGSEAHAPLAASPLSTSFASRLIVAWDFSDGIRTTRATDRGPLRLHGSLVNLPARGMKGSGWTGTHHSWQAAPAEYGAVHFHEDDLYDAGWPADIVWQLPEDAKSGAYALHVRCGETGPEAMRECYIPFFIRPPRVKKPGIARPKVAFLAPTCSYMAYANHGEHITVRGVERLMGRLLHFGHQDVYLYDHPELCHSLYDKHADGSGVCYSSRVRPNINCAPRYHSWLGGDGSSLYQYNADTHLFGWLAHHGIEYDIITDEDLHRDGYPLIADYDVILTGSHPEYHSTAMWDAMKSWIDRGGRLMYMGGNGWYWRIAFHDELPGVIEVRRAEDGIRSWEAEPGEYYHSFTGEYGGLWRRCGRPPNMMAGIGFVAQGFDVSSPYRRAPDADNPRAAFIFEGVEDEVIGDFGLIGGGAAGIELDCINPLLGSPPNILRLASSEDHSPLMLLVNEEFTATQPNLGGDQNERVRADLSFYETAAGGAVFATGSIAWCGSLPCNGYENNISRITLNALKRFMDPKPFV